MVFLTSTGFQNPKVFNLLKSSRREIYSNACIIMTGIPGKKNHPIVQNTVKFLSDHKIIDIRLLDVEFDDPSLLSIYDLIIILGGNSAHLFYHLKRSEAEKYIIQHVKEGKDIIGASAGSWFLASGRCADDFSFLGIDETYPYNVDSRGLNFIKEYIFPHYDMFLDKIDNLEQKLKDVEKEKQVKFIRLKNIDFIYKDNEGILHTVIEE